MSVYVIPSQNSSMISALVGSYGESTNDLVRSDDVRVSFSLLSEVVMPILGRILNNRGVNGRSSFSGSYCCPRYQVIEEVPAEDSRAKSIISNTELFEQFMTWNLFTSKEDVRVRMGEDMIGVINAVDDDLKVDRVTEALQIDFFD